MKLTLRELLGGVIVLPPVAYASGYFLWVGASFALYGANFAPHLGVASLIEPGIIYTATLVIGALAAYVIGLERLSARPFRATRRLSMTRQSLFWLLILVLASVLAQAVARGYPLLGRWAILVPTIYVPLHLILLTSAFRRLFGLLHGSVTPTIGERRALTSATRVWQGCLVCLLCILQVYLALLFAVLGPNTAMRVIPIVVELRTEVRPRPQGDTVELLLLERSKERILGYHPERREVVELPAEAVRQIQLPRLSRRQLDFLEALEKVSSIPADQAGAYFPIRSALMRLEIDDLVRSGEVERAPGGALRRAATVGPGGR